MKVNRFSILNVLDIVSRILMAIGIVLIFRRLHKMDIRAIAALNAAQFERQLLANVMGVELKVQPFAIP